jgi:hypothetical protein
MSIQTFLDTSCICDAQINVEIYSSAKSVKYIFMYAFLKGCPAACMAFFQNFERDAINYDEMLSYVSMRYVKITLNVVRNY